MYIFLLSSYINYLCEIWTNTYKTNIQCIFLLQKQIVRIITHSEYLANTDDLFENLLF